MTVRVVTDSAACIPAELAERLDISVVPLQLTIDGRSCRDGDVPLDAVLAATRVTTSAPSPGDFVAALGDGDTVVATVAAGMSATYRSASLAARLAGGGRVRVVDTGSAAGGEGLVVLAAARAAAAGRPLDAVEQAARRAAAAVRLVAAVAGFDRLVRSGRVPALAGWAGERLGVQPLFAFSGGSVRPLRPAANRSAALARLLRLLVDDVRRAGTPPPAVHVAVLHAGAAGEAGGLLERVAALTDPATAFVAEFSTVMVAHTGPGLIGLAWRCETRPAERASERVGPAGSARRR